METPEDREIVHAALMAYGDRLADSALQFIFIHGDRDKYTEAHAKAERARYLASVLKG